MSFSMSCLYVRQVILQLADDHYDAVLVYCITSSSASKNAKIKGTKILL